MSTETSPEWHPGKSSSARRPSVMPVCRAVLTSFSSADDDALDLKFVSVPLHNGALPGVFFFFSLSDACADLPRHEGAAGAAPDASSGMRQCGV